jgi:6-phosphogluconate dehydrogenase
MLPAEPPTRDVLAQLVHGLAAGDLVIDAGNRDFRDAGRGAAGLAERGIAFVDAGVSGGQSVWKHGYGIAVGAAEPDYRWVEPVLRDLAAEGGYAHIGGVGSGHFVKAVHDGVRFAGHDQDHRGERLVSAARKQIGGHLSA